MNKSPIYDPVKRRCVIHSVLKDYLAPEYCMKALWVLENNYAKQHSLPILEFIDQIEQLAPLGNKKKPLRERLTKELYFNDTIGEDPWDDMLRFKRVLKISEANQQAMVEPSATGSQQNSVKDSSNNDEMSTPETQGFSAELVIFEHFISELNHFYTQHSKGHIQKFYSYLISQLPELTIKPEAEAAIIAWCHHDGDCGLSDVFETDEMTAILHVCYLWGCEALGPEQTDKVYARALHSTEALPEADEFSPTELM